MTASDLFAALAHPLRLRLLNLLRAEKEICVCDLCEILDELQPTVSRHLALLREAGFVDVRSEGKWKFYALSQPTSRLHRSLLRCVPVCREDASEADGLTSDLERLGGTRLRLRCR